jgi:branched-chain amino acid transport system permease protein
MAVKSDIKSAKPRSIRSLWLRTRAQFSQVPLLGWLLGGLVAVILEQLVGTPLARVLGMSKMPVLFGVDLLFEPLGVLADYITAFFGWAWGEATAVPSFPLQALLKELAVIPPAILYVLLIYILPVSLVARLTQKVANRLAARLLSFHTLVSVLLHLGLLYAILHIWALGPESVAYRGLVSRLALIAVMATLSLNVVNGYMGEFSCSHPGFMALGAYMASLFTVVLFVQDNKFGAPLLPEALGPFLFPVGLILAGIVSAVLGVLAVGVPSFRTRGDYLAIISLAFMFIVKSFFENVEAVGGARGLSGQPDWASLPIVFIWTALCIWTINNFVRSTVGKALNAVRDGELAADAMTVDTRRTKMLAFSFAAFWAGLAGGLFAHVLRYVNPDTFGLKKLAEVLAMVYLGGLNSVVGSIVGATGYTLLSEALRPLDLWKWIIIPVMLILLMIFRPTGLIAFREFDIRKLVEPRADSPSPDAEPGRPAQISSQE